MLQIDARLEQHPPRVLVWEDARLLLHVEGQEVRCLLDAGYLCPADLAHPCHQKECLCELLRGVAAYFPQKSLEPEPPGRCQFWKHSGEVFSFPKQGTDQKTSATERGPVSIPDP